MAERLLVSPVLNGSDSTEEEHPVPAPEEPAKTDASLGGPSSSNMYKELDLSSRDYDAIPDHYLGANNNYK